jgi:nicotinamide-nucleotide amidase
VAAALARGARERCAADWGLATTGVAGPGPQGGIAPGVVFIAVAGSDRGGPAQNLEVQQLLLAGDRAAVRAATVVAAIDLLLSRLV